ncbi:MAG: rhomboid family intramembrane serine protease [Bacteroidales bacterium]
MTIIIIVITVIISLLGFSNNELRHKLLFNAWYIKHENQYWRFITHAFLHADFIHLIVNMYVLYSFGRVIESGYGYYFGHKAYFYYFLLYLGGILFSCVQDFAKQKDNALFNSLGASGAVSAVVFASILIYPQGSIRFFFIPIDIPNVIFGLIYLYYSYYMGKRGRGNINHFAHFWGAVFGVVYGFIIKPQVIISYLSNLL